MDWTDIISLVFGGGGILSLAGSAIAWILFYRENKKKAEIENRSAEADLVEKTNNQWQELYNECRNEKDKYYEEMQKQRDAKIELRDNIQHLKIELTKCSILRCNRVDCQLREPPLNINVDETDVT